jgi:hypothetical protein
MPRLKRRGKVLRDSLTDAQAFNLLIGCDPAAFASEQERREAWTRHRHELSTNPLTRPVAWWDYDSPEPLRNRRLQGEQLFGMGLLSSDEIALMKRERRFNATNS